ncbi:MAG TPA: hypothetical protein VMM93_08555 [Vicinamibacterales bacterium]|nr:hypothetical protein [Vicinamibacterales bacterium]
MPVRSRLLSAGIIGVSVWCAAGELTVATAASPVVRLAAPASPFWALAGVLLGLSTPGLRPLRAIPALFATLPWWPVPIPVAFVIFTGPLAWWPIGLAVAGAVVAAREARARPAGHGPFARAGRQAGVAALLTLALGAATATSIADRLPGGDEPHYLIITDSLLRDGDLRIENNHRNRDYAAYFDGTMSPDFIRRGADGEIYSIHAPGVSALVLPAFALAGYRGAQATILGCAALAGALVWLIGWRATGRADAAWFAWAAITLTPTTLLLSGMVFPDGPGALATAAGLWLGVRLLDQARPVRTGILVGVSALLAFLPWLHTRFSILAGGLGLLLVWRIWIGGDGRLRRAVVFAAVPVAAALLWFGHFWIIYGTPDPTAPYGDNAGSRLAYIPGGLVALLFDQQFGLLAYSPVLAALALGLGQSGSVGMVSAARVAAVIGLVYSAAVTTYWMWWAGLPAPPARFLTAALPLAALPLSRSWAGAGEGTRAVLALLLAVSASIALVTAAVGGGALAWNVRDGQAAWLEWLGPVVNLPRAWPSFFWKLDPADLTSELPFVRHVAVFAGLVAGALVVVARLSTGRAAAAGLFGLAMPAAVMVAASTGWWLNDVTGLDPARSQMAIASAEGAGRRLLRIEAWRAGFEVSVLPALRIRPDEAGRADAPPSATVFELVPPGRYELDVLVSDPAPGRLDLRIGRSASPVRSVVVPGPGTFNVPLSLPSGAEALSVEALDEAGAAITGTDVTLRIVSAAVRAPLAVWSARFGDVDVFFTDRQVFVEPGGFWVRGSSEAGVHLLRESGPGVVQVVLRNGGSTNRVAVSIDGRREEWELAASEERRLDVPVGAGGVRLRVHSTNGFRPSDDAGSDDRRFLGVWVEIAPR